MCLTALNVFCLFQRLKSQSTKYRTDRTYSTKTAEKQDNVKKNRYKDIVPCMFCSLPFTLLHGMINNMLHRVKRGSVTLWHRDVVGFVMRNQRSTAGQWQQNSHAHEQHERCLRCERKLDATAQAHEFALLWYLCSKYFKNVRSSRSLSLVLIAIFIFAIPCWGQWAMALDFTLHTRGWFQNSFLLISVDHSRVKLTLATSKNDTDYINANFIKVCQQCTCTEQRAQSLLQYLPLLTHATLKCASFQTNNLGSLWLEAAFLPSGGVGFEDIYCHPGSSAPHCAGLPEDDLGVQY